MTTEFRKAVWNSMLDADMNARYWKKLVSKFIWRDTVLKIFMAVMASGTVASWGFWESNVLVWKFLSSVSALAAIALPILNHQKKIEAMSELAGKWAELRIEYEDMWLALRNKPNHATLTTTYKKFRSIESNLEKKETTLPSFPIILKECQTEVKISRGLN